MSSKLTIDLIVSKDVGGNAKIVVCVIHQDESLRNKGNIKTIDGFTLSSYSRPQLTNNTLYIRGDNRTSDDSKSRRYYDSYKKALDIVKKIEKVVESIGGEVNVTLN